MKFFRTAVWTEISCAAASGCIIAVSQFRIPLLLPLAVQTKKNVKHFIDCLQV